MLTKDHYSLALASQVDMDMGSVVIAFSDALRAMRKIALGTDACNRHPISVLYAAQITRLAGLAVGASMPGYSQAVAACERGMEEEE